MTTTFPGMTSPIPLYIGYDWLIPVALMDSAGHPLDISTWTVSGDLWLPGQSLGQASTILATDINVPAASFAFFVPRISTAQVAPQTPVATTFPCRIMVGYTDAAGDRFALRPIYILPLDPRTSTL